MFKNGYTKLVRRLQKYLRILCIYFYCVFYMLELNQEPLKDKIGFDLEMK